MSLDLGSGLATWRASPRLLFCHERDLRDESRLVLVAGVGTLLDLDHLEVFEHLEPVPALDEQNDVAGAQLPAFEIRLLLIEEVHAQAPALDEERLLSVGDATRDRVVNVWGDDLARGMLHIRQLLRKIVRREKADTGLREFVAHDEREHLTVVLDFLYCAGGGQLKTSSVTP